MSTGFILLALGMALMVGIALRIFSSFSRSNGKRREDLGARQMSHQPWDSAGGRTNR